MFEVESGNQSYHHKVYTVERKDDGCTYLAGYDDVHRKQEEIRFKDRANGRVFEYKNEKSEWVNFNDRTSSDTPTSLRKLMQLNCDKIVDAFDAQARSQQQQKQATPAWVHEGRTNRSPSSSSDKGVVGKNDESKREEPSSSGPKR